MSAEDVLEGNKLIAEFMQYEVAGTAGNTNEVLAYYLPDNHLTHAGMYPADDLRFHSSWDWLMPVVEKIRDTLHVRITIEMANEEDVYGKYHCWITGYGETHMAFPQFRVNHASSLLEAIWEAVIRFIKWYNKNNK